MDPARAAVRELGSDACRAEPARPGPARVGRDGSLHLRFARRGDRTVLVSRRFCAPLQVLEPLDLAGDGSAFVVLLSPGGGVLGGDHLRTEIEVGRGAHVGVATPSATKVYRTSGLPAVQHTSITLAEDAILEYVPHHLIPHPGAALEQSFHVDLGPGSRLILYDAFSLGRVARGESWAFHSLTSEVRVTDARGPLYWDRVRLAPDRARTLAGLGGAEGCAYVGTLLLCGPARSDGEGMAGALADLLARQPDIRGGVSFLPRNGCVVKILSPSAHALTRFAVEAWAIARRHLLGLPPLELRLG